MPVAGGLPSAVGQSSLPLGHGYGRELSHASQSQTTIVSMEAPVGILVIGDAMADDDVHVAVNHNAKLTVVIVSACEAAETCCQEDFQEAVVQGPIRDDGGSKAMGVDYYKILHVNQNAKEDDLKKAYWKLAMKLHLDKNPKNKKQAEAKFKQISEAYDLRDL
ncbi:hypothetical protein NE237_001891 [Protea cynaroides]|uniref:J domain-containing protein n=1 Tax=Protea cynaroides TaxID=273540 RepID=A0A9Q0QYX8_9MAGN|nr:hypothetical protein NE237_001891 [Protea cynaroides]